MTDVTAGASTEPEVEPESETDAPVPDTTPDPSTTTEAAPEVSTPGRIVPAIDGSVEQGNRVTAVSEITRTDPLAAIKGKIVDHAENTSHIVGDLRALADELEQALNKVRVGL